VNTGRPGPPVGDVSAADLAVAVRMLMRAGRDMQGAMADRLGLGATDLLAMDEVIRGSESIGPVELGRRLGITSASATVLVDRLQAAGHLERRPHSADARRVTLHATSSALTEVRQAVRPLVEAVSRISEDLDQHDRRVVLDFLAAMTRALHEYPGTIS
jgi:DNA-binding MarR family transcriptional regulator